MASILSSLFGRTKLYEPSPRFAHGAAAVGGRCYLRGGHVQDLTENGRRKLASTVEIFDPYLETWEEHHTTGVSPPGLYGRACTSLLDSLYWFGGWDGSYYYNSLHRLDTTTLEWREIQPLNKADGPMRKSKCEIVSFLQDKLAVFGGYGIPTGPTQPGAMFTKDTDSTDGSGWSNELHVFNITEGKWSSPPTTGPRPPPSAHFSFTAINNHQAVFFGGSQPGRGIVSDCYLMDFESMKWTKLERPEGASWPVERAAHAACCLNYGEEHPQLLVTGGVDKSGNTLQDAWILDVSSGRWRELTLPEGAQPRMSHTATALSLGLGWTQVTMFGGCPKWESGKSLDALQKLAKTTVLDFGSVWSPPSGDRPPTKEWVLVGMADSRQLGSVQRMREKMVNMKQSAIGEVEAGRQALREAQSQQALDQRVQDAEARAQDLQTQLEASQGACQVLHQSLQTSEQSHQRTQADKQALEGALEESQLRERALQERVTTAAQEAREQVHVLQQSVSQANTQVEHLQRRLEEAENRAEEAERRAHEGRHEERETEGEPTWVVRKDEIIFTDEELGRGGWAVVKVAKFRATCVAAKCLHGQIVSNYNRLLFIREMNMAARVRHPNLLQFIGATLHGELIILTELMPTSVRQELENERTFSPKQLTSISLDVARALNYLHLMHPDPIIHRDISSANVLLEPNSWRAKVSDYGSVNLLQRLRTVTPGNPTYAAPEAENATLQSPKMDIFSFGVLLVEMYTALFPEVADRERLIRSILQPDMVALIRQCLAEEKDVRPSASDIITELSEPHNT